MPNITRMVSGVVLVIIAIIVIFQIIGGTATDLANAGANVSLSGLPLASLFSSSGVVMLVFMAGILLAVIGLALGISSFKN